MNNIYTNKDDGFEDQKEFKVHLETSLEGFWNAVGRKLIFLFSF